MCHLVKNINRHFNKLAETKLNVPLFYRRQKLFWFFSWKRLGKFRLDNNNVIPLFFSNINRKVASPMRPLQGGAAFIRCDFAKKTNQDAPEHFIAFSARLSGKFSWKFGYCNQFNAPRQFYPTFPTFSPPVGLPPRIKTFCSSPRCPRLKITSQILTLCT